MLLWGSGTSGRWGNGWEAAKGLLVSRLGPHAHWAGPGTPTCLTDAAGAQGLTVLPGIYPGHLMPGSLINS